MSCTLSMQIVAKGYHCIDSVIGKKCTCQRLEVVRAIVNDRSLKPIMTGGVQQNVHKISLPMNGR